MFNATRNDLYLKLISSSAYSKFGNSTISFKGIKLNLDPTTAFSLITSQLLKRLQSQTSSQYEHGLYGPGTSSSGSSTRLTDFLSSTTLESVTIHEEIESIVARINLFTMLFGIIGNFICICVLMQKTLLNRKFNWYLLILALADLIFCFIVFINYYIVFTNPSRALYDLSKITCYFTDYVVSSIDAFCVYLTLVLSIDRLYAIKKPIKSKMFLTYRFPRRIAILGYLTILLIKSPDLFLSQREYIHPSVAHHFTHNFTENGTLDMSKYDIVYESIGKEYCHSTNMFSSTDLKENQSQIVHIIYIIYCNVVMPLFFNIIPAFVILVLNLALWFFMRQYSYMLSTNPSELLLKNSSKSSFVNRSVKRSISTTQKSHYFTIIMLGIWLLITTIPYYTLFTYHWATSLKLINDKTRLHMTIQAISSAFFNSNHCINIIIYMIFHKDFRLNALKIFFNFFNLNPLIKLNPQYLKAKRPSDSVKDLNRSRRLRNANKSQKAHFNNFVDDLDETTLNENETRLKRLSTLTMSDDSKSFSAFNLSDMSPRKLFLPNQNLSFLKLFAKKKHTGNNCRSKRKRMSPKLDLVDENENSNTTNTVKFEITELNCSTSNSYKNERVNDYFCLKIKSPK